MDSEREIYVPPGGPPRGPGPSREIFATMGAENIYAMLADVYREIEAAPIRDLFPTDMEAASRRSAEFFIGLLGGPPIYMEKHGHPRMRARHLPFPIDEAARQEWLSCFDRVLEQAVDGYAFPREHLAGFRRFLDEFSAWMVNTA